MAHVDKRVRGYCHDCENIKPITGRGLCGACWARRKKAGTLHELPKGPLIIERYEEYLDLYFRVRPPLSHRQMAEKIGVNIKTIERYSYHRRGLLVIGCLKAVGY